MAFLIPFELFLFSYVVLGALHYLTELTWLHEKNYFTSAKTELFLIFGCAIFISINYIWHRLQVQTSFEIPFLKPIYGVHFIFLAFVMAISASILKSWKEKLVLFLLAGIGIFLFRNQFYYLFLIGLLLPTLIHVFVFTGIFMLVGIKKKPTFYSKLCFFTFLACASSFVFVPAFGSPWFILSKEVQSNFLGSGFDVLNKMLLSFFEPTTFALDTKKLIFESSIAIKIQRFIAFAYTYHYLNWFLKVRIIAWHKVNKWRFAIAIFLWLAALAIYLYDFQTGILTLYFLSMLHVLMEFPLNIQSIVILIKK